MTQLEARGYGGMKSLSRDPAGNWAAKAMRNNVEVAVISSRNRRVRGHEVAESCDFVFGSTPQA